eukprot:13445693-Ditylum_brightwellii.AAC.1
MKKKNDVVEDKVGTLPQKEESRKKEIQPSVVRNQQQDPQQQLQIDNKKLPDITALLHPDLMLENLSDSGPEEE